MFVELFLSPFLGIVRHTSNIQLSIHFSLPGELDTLNMVLSKSVSLSLSFFQFKLRNKCSHILLLMVVLKSVHQCAYCNHRSILLR